MRYFHQVLAQNFLQDVSPIQKYLFCDIALKDSICIIYSHQYVIASFAHEMNMFSRETHLRICGCSVKEMMSSGYTF